MLILWLRRQFRAVKRARRQKWIKVLYNVAVLCLSRRAAGETLRVASGLRPSCPITGLFGTMGFFSIICSFPRICAGDVTRSHVSAAPGSFRVRKILGPGV